MGIRKLAESNSDSVEPLKLMTAEYTVEESGHLRDEPIMHLLCRRPDGSRRHIEVEGFYPYFYISADEFEEKKKEIVNEGRIRWVEVSESVMEDDRDLQFLDHIHASDDPVNTLGGDSLVKIVCGTPDHMNSSKGDSLVGYFDTTWEADVFYVPRFLISTGIQTGFRAPTDTDRLSVDDLTPIEPEDTPRITPRAIYLDIEVLVEDGNFPEPTEADQPITSISAYDNYDDEYKAWILHNEEWDIPGGEGGSKEDFDTMEDHFEEQYAERFGGCSVSVFTDEAHLLDDFHKYVSDRRPDILTGWNAANNDKSNGFDFPYLINRSFKVNAWNVNDWSPLDDGDVFVTRAGTAVVEGVELFDLMDAYEKTQIHELRSYALGYVAQKECGYGKEDIDDISKAWINNPVDFLKYNIRDTEAMVEIDHAQADDGEKHGILQMYDHLRDVTGQLYTECHHNISMIDMLFLRDALKKNVALPTSKKPDVKHYHGAKVFNPAPGRHENVFYPDLASLYPNLFWATNMSPETIVGSAADLEASEYTKDDCFVVYYDPRDEHVKKAGDNDDVVEDPLYVLKPEIEEGFVRDSIGDLIDMKYEYKGTSKYGAVKRVTNSVYGVMGDSDTYGRGFRLFDVQIAEAITLAGRKVLEYTATTMVDYLHDQGYDDVRLVGGDTDSAMLAGQSLSFDPEQLQRAAEGKETHPVFEAAEYANNAYDGYMAETFNIRKEDGYEHKMEVEVESAADAIFFLQDYKSGAEEGDGIKKKYCQLITWDEDDGVIENPSPKTKGFQLVRSDSATITAWTQEEVLRLILVSETPKDDVYDFLEDAIGSFEAGDLEDLSAQYGSELTLEDVGIPKGIGSSLDQYGREKLNDESYGEHVRTPSPVIRGAKWANQNIEAEDISSGSKPLLFYVEPGRIGGELPETYSTEESLEDGDLVDAISVNDHENFPVEARVDWGTMVEKVVQNPIEDITKTMGWQWDDITNEGRQSGLDAWA